MHDLSWDDPYPIYLELLMQGSAITRTGCVTEQFTQDPSYVRYFRCYPFPLVLLSAHACAQVEVVFKPAFSFHLMY